ncbi:hypothetical protein IEZ26_13020 [Nocardioides cavernae]|uniref:Ricin B lectin domain-containing protein n=1 Tax=Nocardioides cavernae TaxID=1921566 RepID=A0ABR8NEA6_9ACTN|nr:hypothetical protein [Nocardioides cavernae]MBD3925551.1 hypothetical protein [Nocardioides cavernae]MBM7514069.1 hypothetical protein [Nocardioides cavernae]
MSRITGVIVALATTAAVLTGSTSGAAPPSAPGGVPGLADLPREIEGGVELTLADGDVFRVWVDEDYRTVWGKRYDAATRMWGGRQEVLREKDLSCGDVDARTANGAVAVMAKCDRGSYSDDQAPTASHALWSADTVTWSSFLLEGEAYDEPGISPGGNRAVWPEFHGYVTWGPEGFTRYAFEAPREEYTTTVTITDDAQISYLYGAHVSRRRCAMVVLTRTGDAAPTRQEVEVDDSCQDRNFANVDSNTAVFGEFALPASVAVISRPDSSSPWAVTRVAPLDAPGLTLVQRGLRTDIFTAPGVPLVALGSRSGRRVRAQVYDPVGQAWGPAVSVHESRTRCRWGSSETVQPLAVLVAVVTCGGNNVALTTRDGLAWQALRMGPRTLGQSADGRYVAVPGPTSTHVISPERGVVTLPGGVTGRCDVVVPDGPDGAVQLVAGQHSRRWPVLLRHLSADGAYRLGRSSAPTAGRCAGTEQSWDRPSRFEMDSTRIDQGQTVGIVRRGDGWTVRIQRW